jgi:hypothetical protein
MEEDPFLLMQAQKLAQKLAQLAPVDYDKRFPLC